MSKPTAQAERLSYDPHTEVNIAASDNDKDIDLLPLISTWLDSVNSKISEFRIGAEWRGGPPILYTIFF